MQPQPGVQQAPVAYGVPSGYTQPYYGPSIGERIGRSFAAKIGIAILIISIVGLILAMVVPWAMYEYNPTTGEGYKGSYNYDMEKTSGDDSAPEDFPGSDDSRNYYSERAGFSITGFILGIIFGSILIASGMITLPRYQNLLHIANTIIGGVMLFPAALCMTSGSSFINLMLMEAHSNTALKDLGFDVTTSVVSPAGFVMLVMGVILLGVTILLIKRELLCIIPSQAPSRPSPMPVTQMQTTPQQTQPPASGGGY